MSKFIEVFGESEYQEYPLKLVIDIDVSIRAVKEETAKTEIQDIVNDILDKLFENGLSKNDVTFGGRETFTPWWKRNKVGVETKNKITIISENRVTVYSALDKIDQYKSDKRITVSINERQPIFEAAPGDIEKAISNACDNAKKKAELLASATGVCVGKPIEIQEFKRGVRRSGSYGDYDYGDYEGITIAAASASVLSENEGEYENPAARIEGNNRIVFIKYRIKYEIKENEI